MAYHTPVTRLEYKAAHAPDDLHSTSPEFPDGLSFDTMLTYVAHLAEQYEKELSARVDRGAKITTLSRASISYFVHMLAVPLLECPALEAKKLTSYSS